MKTAAISFIAVGLLSAAPAMAQMSNTMGADPAMGTQPTMSEHATPAKPAKPLSMVDQKKWDACKAMAHDAMMKDAKCTKMAKDHPELMGQPNM